MTKSIIVRSYKSFPPGQVKDYLANRRFQWTIQIGKALCLDAPEAEQLLPQVKAQGHQELFDYSIESRTQDLENRLRGQGKAP